ncbi:MAG: pilus assembly protein PilM [bacterium]|nr:pilus assembly protein PilM [bacterium]
MFIHSPLADGFGLDIGDLSIKLIQLTRSWRLNRSTLKLQEYYKIKEMRSVKLPPGYIVNGEIQQPENVRHKLLHLLGKDGSAKPIHSPWVVADLPEPKTFLKLIEIDMPPNDITEDDILFQAKKHLPFDLSEAVTDWQIVNPNPSSNKSNVLFAAVPKVISDSYTYLLESVGLTPAVLEVEAISLVRSLITANKDYGAEARAILDLGATRSGLVIYDQGTIQFSTTLTFSGEIVTTAIEQGLKITREEAEKMKTQNGLVYDKANPKYLKIIADLTERLIAEIKKSLLFYKTHFPHCGPVTHITLCGGVSTTLGLDAAIARSLKISARPGNAWKNLANPQFGEADRKRGLLWSSAVGLALHAIENDY